MTRLLCTLLIFALTLGCGKKINDLKSNSASHYEQPEELSVDLTLEVDEAVSSTTIFEIPKNAMFKLPTELIARDGNALGKKIIIFYNFSNSRDYKFQCTYHSIDQDTTLAFEKCTSSNGNKIISNNDNTEDMWFPMDKGSQVKLQLTNPSGSGVKIESVYQVEWK